MGRVKGGRFGFTALALAVALGSALTLGALKIPRHLWSDLVSQAVNTETEQNYIAKVQARPLRGISENLSGLTYNHGTNTLFAVLNSPERIVEFDRKGRVLRILPVGFGSDLEGISHIKDNLFAIASEAGNMVWATRIDPTTGTVVPTSQQTLSISFNRKSNQGMEGVSWDNRGNRLFLANEKNPLQIIEVHGLLELIETNTANLRISIWNPYFALKQLAGDISSISFNEQSNSMAVLSHESRRVYQFDDQGKASLMLRLEKGRHGLRQSVDQAEGLAFGPDGSIYIVAEPNLFYRFTPAGSGN
jgi:uncharacterized protein YjiK